MLSFDHYNVLLFRLFCSFFFFNVAATTEIYTLSLHDALPILSFSPRVDPRRSSRRSSWPALTTSARSEEHTSELQSPDHLVCRLLLEKKNYKQRKTDFRKRILR